MNLRHTLPILSLVCAGFHLAAQHANFVWAKQFGGNLNDNCYSACDQAGNVYRMQGGVARHNSMGVQQWTVTSAYQAQDVTFDEAGSMNVLAIFNNTVDLDHGPGTFTVASAGAIDIALLKLDAATGAFVWGGSIGGSNSDYDAVIHTDTIGNVYVGGSFTGVYDVDPGPGVVNLTATATDFYVARLNPAGILQWSKQFTGNSQGWVGSIDVDPAGDVYFCGSFSGTMDFDPGAPVNNLSSSSPTVTDLYICKLDASGNFSWVKQIGATGADYGQEIQIGSNGNLYCSGRFTGLVDFDAGPGTLTLNSGTVTQAFVAEFNSSGTPNWVRNFSGFYITDMAVDRYNGICMTGQFTGADFDPGPGTYSMVANGTWPDIYISKLSPAGHFMWAKRLGSLNEDGPTTISVDGTNNIHLAGRFKTTCDFDPNAGYFAMTAVGGNFNYDAFMLRLCQTPGLFYLDGGATVCEGSSPVYSVNPAPDATAYSWGLPGGWTGSSTTHSIVATAGSSGGTVVVTAGNSCGVTPKSMQVTVDVCAGIGNEIPAAEGLYPNPSNGTVYLEVSQSCQFRVFSELGQVMMQGMLQPGKNSLEMHGLGKGMYFVELARVGERSVMKLVIE